MLRLPALLLALWLLAVNAAAADSPITFVLYSPDGRSLATGHQDGAVKLREPGTGAVERQVRQHRGPVEGLAWCGDELVSWDGSSKILAALPVPGGLAVATRQGLLLQDPQRRTVLRRFDLSPLPGTRLAAGGGLLAANRGPAAVIYDLATGKRLGKLRKDAVFDIADMLFTPDGRLLTLDAHSVREWEVPSGRPLRQWTGLGFERADRLFQSGRWLLAGGVVQEYARTVVLGGEREEWPLYPLGFAGEARALARGEMDPEGMTLFLKDLQAGVGGSITATPPSGANVRVAFPRVALDPRGRAAAFAFGDVLQVVPIPAQNVHGP